VRAPIAVLLVQLALGAGFVLFVLLGGLPGGEDADGSGPASPAPARLKADRFDSRAAWRLLREQVELGPRPAGSAASRRLAARLRRLVPGGRYQAVPGGLRNVVGRVPGREPDRVVVVGAHYDTKDLPGFVGANDGASGTAVVVELARTVRPRTLRPTLAFALFDGEESSRGTPDSDFEQRGLRGSKVAARAFGDAEAMILLDFVGDRRLRTPREGSSDPGLWKRLRAAAVRIGAGAHFPDETTGSILDDHTPFLEQGVPAIDLIDFDFPCWHRRCDDLWAVSERSLDVTGETVLELLRRL
jgi:glutaminyl-peptide cyclotransferase